jgi:acetyl-CoA synthetase
LPGRTELPILDLARKDEDGYFWFVGRKDGIISSGGYHIGPGEIEDCLAGHSAVAVAAAVGSPDAVAWRGRQSLRAAP